MYKRYKVIREYNRQYLDNKVWRILFSISLILKKHQGTLVNKLDLLDEYYKTFEANLKSLRIKNHKSKNILFGHIRFIKKTKKIEFGIDQIYRSSVKHLRMEN